MAGKYYKTHYDIMNNSITHKLKAKIVMRILTNDKVMRILCQSLIAMCIIKKHINTYLLSSREINLH